ncbi:aminodeoxychorismate lyase [Rhodococcus sp. HNM0569]|uniref:aminodeoxychorismate lyase n=1 Tax=Rhodococcus sp. HNM0569 TaxID=2716340 RepID=UPI00146D69B0|nr:aminodeoxychorismate lyase [Rhodococcus sp. HNM0569]NLU82352.1 aminodeoxychorismate lyase [Rhodococcus sp. HNM0569]
MADRVLVTLDHEVHDADAPFVCADDLGLVRGDGAFETLLVRGGRALQVDAHLARLADSARTSGLQVGDLDDWRLAIELAAEEWGSGDEGALRLVLTRGRESGGDPTAFVTVGAVSERVLRVRQEGVAALTLTRGISVDLASVAPWQLLGAKTLSYATNMAAIRHAEANGADDVVFVSSEGFVLEGPRSTVVIARDDTFVTPPVSQGILSGTTQRALFDVATARGITCEYAALRPADLITADGVWLVSSITLAARVRELDGLALREPDIAADFAELIDAAVEGEGAAAQPS